LVTLVANTYDVYPYNQLFAVTSPRQHDASYTSSFVYRGNVTYSTQFASATTMGYDETGNLVSTSDGYGHSAGQTLSSSQNYAAPSAMSVGSIATSFTWNGYNAVTATTGPNSATSSFSYDGYARPSSRTAANGAVTQFAYSSTYPIGRWLRRGPDGRRAGWMDSDAR
jgi:YD repeat-containing protein